jgi:hypothetical protein
VDIPEAKSEDEADSSPSSSVQMSDFRPITNEFSLGASRLSIPKSGAFTPPKDRIPNQVQQGTANDFLSFGPEEVKKLNSSKHQEENMVSFGIDDRKNFNKSPKFQEHPAPSPVPVEDD